MRSIEQAFHSFFLVALATSSVACGEDDGAPYAQGQEDIIEAQREAREISSGPPTGSGTPYGPDDGKGFGDRTPSQASPLGPEANSPGESSSDGRLEQPRMQMSERP
jgi:hypothetical protein